MKNFLFGLFTVILLSMLVLTFQANLERSVFQGRARVVAGSLVSGHASRCLFRIRIFYVWVSYKEMSYASRILWFVLIMGLGNMAIALYGLLQLRKLRPGERWEKLLLSDAA